MLGRKIEFQVRFNNGPEGIKHQHVDKQMQLSGMKKSIGKEPVLLVAVLYVIGIEFELVE